MTLTFELIRYSIKVKIPTKFRILMSNRSDVRVLTDRHTDRRTDGNDFIPSTADAGGKNKLQMKTSQWIFLNLTYILNNILHVFMSIEIIFPLCHKALCITNLHFVNAAGMLPTSVQWGFGWFIQFDLFLIWINYNLTGHGWEGIECRIQQNPISGFHLEFIFVNG